jgi:hypothetical protein
MVKGMHHPKKLKAWVELMRSRNKLNAKSLIMVIDDTNLSKDDLKQLDLKWENQPCPYGGARLTYP